MSTSSSDLKASARPGRHARPGSSVVRTDCSAPLDGSPVACTSGGGRRRIALVAQDHCKLSLLEWASHNRELLARHDLIATDTTGSLLKRELGLAVTRLHSGPLGGDLQLGSLISEGRVDLLLFFWDPLTPQPHDADAKALLRIAVVWNIPVASNRATADFLITSPLLESRYQPHVPSYSRPVGAPAHGRRPFDDSTRLAAAPDRSDQETVA
jgi:methylglyoxal synthase